jgi:hypothetical protein
MGVAGGLENVEEREEKSRTGEDIVTDVLEGHRESGAGMEGGEDAKTPPKDAFFICHRGTRRPNQAADIREASKHMCIEPETCQTRQSRS